MNIMTKLHMSNAHNFTLYACQFQSASKLAPVEHPKATETHRKGRTAVCHAFSALAQVSYPWFLCTNIHQESWYCSYLKKGH